MFVAFSARDQLAFAKSLIDVDSHCTRCGSVDPFMYPRTCVASAVSASRRAAPFAASAADSPVRTADTLSALSPFHRSSWSV